MYEKISCFNWNIFFCLESEDQLKKYKENKITHNASFGDEKELDNIIKKFQQEKEELQKVSNKIVKLFNNFNF